MKNEAICAILDHLCIEARKSVHASFGLVELLREKAGNSDLVAIREASADQLLRCIDDFRELVSGALRPAAIEEFDLGECVGQIVEVLNLTPESPMRRIVLETPMEAIRITQDHKGVEQAITRILDVALKLSVSPEVKVSLLRGPREDWSRLAIASDDPGLARRLASWMIANVRQVSLMEDGDVPYGMSVMVAAKRLRELGGMALPAGDSDGPYAVAVDIPSRVAGENQGDAPGPNCLHILVAEDHDESFALTAMALPDDHVWRARDGREAIKMIKKHRFDVVFVDVHMPGISGYETIRKMRHWETSTGSARTPMVVLSSDDLETQRRSAAEFGCSGFLRKPLSRADVTPLLDRLR